MESANIQITHLINIAREAGENIHKIYHSKTTDWDIAIKSDQSPLTIADRISNEIICSRLHELYSYIPIISEENKEIPYEERKNFSALFMIDPLDGTKEFLKRNGEFAVNIAYIRKNKVVAGVVCVPCLNLIYWAELGKGAFKKEGTQEPTQIFVSDYTPDSENIRIVASRSHNNPATESFIQKFKNPHLVPMGSSLKFLIIAEGKADIYPRLAPTMEWDIAAPLIIVKEAGGTVLSYPQHEEIGFNKSTLINCDFIVSGNIQKS